MHTEYLENQCIERMYFFQMNKQKKCFYFFILKLHEIIYSADRRCPFTTVPESHPRYLDTVVNGVTTEQDCQVRCNTHRDFVCRSYSFYAAASQCFISGDDKGTFKCLKIIFYEFCLYVNFL